MSDPNNDTLPRLSVPDDSTGAVPPLIPPLPKSLVELRDGTAPTQTNPAVLERRQEQIRKLEGEVAQAQDLLAEFERYQAFAQDAPVSANTHRLIDKFLGDKKARIRDAIYHKQTDLRALRSRSQ